MPRRRPGSSSPRATPCGRPPPSQASTSRIPRVALFRRGQDRPRPGRRLRHAQGLDRRGGRALARRRSSTTTPSASPRRRPDRGAQRQTKTTLDHPEDDGGEKAERHDRHNGGNRGCEFHRKLLSDRRGPHPWAHVEGLSVIANPCLLHRTIAVRAHTVLQTRPLGIWFTASNLCPAAAKQLQPVLAPVVNRRRGAAAVFRKPGNEARRRRFGRYGDTIRALLRANSAPRFAGEGLPPPKGPPPIRGDAR